MHGSRLDRVAGIGSLNEAPLHADLKEWYRRPGDRVEAPLGGFVADLLRGDELIEIQTRSFSSMAKKLDHLLDHHRLRLVHPVGVETWIVTMRGDRQTSRRKSPRRGIAADVCVELVSFPALLSHPNFVLEVALVQQEEVRVATRRTRRGWTVLERRLVSVLDTVELAEPADLLKLVPGELPDPFGTADLARALGRPRALAQKVAYCLRRSGAVRVEGRDRSGIRYRLPPGQLAQASMP